MTTILVWLGSQAWWVMVLCLLGAVGYGVTALLNKRKRDFAQFGLEREVYHERMSRALWVTVLFVALAGAVFSVYRVVVPMLPAAPAATPTPSVGLFTPTATPFLSPTPPEATATLTVTEVLTTPVAPTAVIIPTDTPTPTSTPVPEAQMQPDCPSPEAQITLPVAGASLSGVVDVFGTAQVNAFSHYRFEVRFPGTDTPNFIAQYEQAVESGFLGVWDISDPARYPPGGPYRFQLVVVDIYGNATTCTIPVSIVASEG